MNPVESKAIDYGTIKAKFPNLANRAVQIRKDEGKSWPEIYAQFTAEYPEPKAASVSTVTADQAQLTGLEAEIQRLQAENARLRGTGTLTLKVSEKGALSVYGMGRFPVTLYREQWEKLLAASTSIQAFIKANGSRLKLKSDAA